MAEAVIAAAATTGTALLADTITGSVFAFFAKSFLVYGAAQAVSKAISPAPKPFDARSIGQTVMFRAPAAARQVVYGQAMVSGPLLYAGTSGDDNRYLHLVIALAGHQIEAVDQVYFNDKPVSDWDQYATKHQVRISAQNPSNPCDVTLAGVNYSGSTASALVSAIEASGLYTVETQSYWWGADAGNEGLSMTITSVASGAAFSVVPGTNIETGGIRGPKVLVKGDSAYKVNIHLGDANQAADTDLVAAIPEWTTAHQLRGIAYLHVRLTFNPKWWPTGIPNIKALVRGKNDVIDPAGGAAGWTDNWARCVVDYLRYQHGLNCADSEIDMTAASAAASISAEQVEYQTGQYQDRYTVNGAFTLDSSPIDILETLLAAGAGSAVWQMGQWVIRAGAPEAPQPSGINEDDLRGPVSFKPRSSRAELFNAVRGTYVNADDHYQQTDFPEVTNSTYEAEDGERIYTDISLPFTTDGYAAQRLAKITLEEHRQAIVCEFPAKIRAMQYVVGDVIPVSIQSLGWNNKLFRIVDWTMDGIGGPKLLLKEYASSVWSWNLGEATTIDLAPNTTLPDPRQPAAPSSLFLESGNGQLVKNADGTVLSYILAGWIGQDGYAERYDVEFKRSSDTVWTRSGQTQDQEWLVGPVEDGVSYDVRVRTVNILGAQSDWTTTTGHTVIGKTAAPPDPTGLTFSALSDGTRQFTPAVTNKPADLAGYIYRARAGSWSTWSDLSEANGGLHLHDDPVSSAPWETGQIPAGQYTIGVKLIDTSGNESANAALITTTLPAQPSSVTKTSELTDDAGLGQTAEWSGVNGRPDNAENLVQKSGFEDQQLGYWGADPDLAIYDASADGAAHRFVLQLDDRVGAPTEYFPVVAGETLYVSGWICTLRVDPVVAPTGAAIGVHFADSAQATISWSRVITQAPGAGWQYIEGSVVVPDGAVKARPFVIIESPAGTAMGSAEFTGLRVARTQPGADVTGSNTAAGIAGQGSLATADTVGTPDIDANSVTTINGATFADASPSLYAAVAGWKYSTLGQLSITADGDNKVMVNATITASTTKVNNSSSFNPYYQIWRDGTLLEQRFASGTDRDYAFIINDTPPAGSHTYYIKAAIQVNTGSGTNPGYATFNAREMRMTLQGVKR